MPIGRARRGTGRRLLWLDRSIDNQRSGPNTWPSADPAANTIENATTAPTMREAVENCFMVSTPRRAAYYFLP